MGLINLHSVVLVSLPSLLLACGGVAVPQDPLFDVLGPWHQRHISCGHPAFFYRLPHEEQNKIRDIWAHYEAGDECEKEKEATRQVIQSIPDEVRFKLFHGMCGPAFLKDATSAVRTQFQNVWFDEKLTLDEKEAEFKKLAYSLLSGDALKKFNEFETEITDRKKARQQTIDGLSATARTAYEKWNSMRKEERLYLASLTPEIRSELKLVCTFCGTHKVGQTSESHHHHLRQRRSAHADAIVTAASLRRAEADILSAQADCTNVY